MTNFNSNQQVEQKTKTSLKQIVKAHKKRSKETIRQAEIWQKQHETRFELHYFRIVMAFSWHLFLYIF